jgi:LPS export ABC transporter protein LptC
MRNTVVLIVLALLAAATGLLRWQRGGPSPAPVVEQSASPLGYYVSGARLLGTDEGGRLAYRVFATRLDELPEEQRLELGGVSVDYRPVGETPWTISATSASAPKDGSRIDLVGDVELKSSPTDGSEATTVVTQELRFSPDRSSAETDEAVTVYFGDWEFEGAGLRVDLKGDTLELESGHGEFFER